VASKKRSGKGKGPRQGISGNPQRRAEQLVQRRAVAGEPDLEPLVLDFRSEKADSPLRDLAYALAGGAQPGPWWARPMSGSWLPPAPLPGRPASST
jgi:hypothetical protein